MRKLLDEEWIEELPQNIVENLNYINNYIIEIICKRIEQVGLIGKSDVNKLENALKYSLIDLRKIQKEIAKTTNKNIKEIDKLFEDVAKENIDFSNVFYAYRGLKTLKSYKENKALKDLVESIKIQAMDDYKNISNTYGFMTHGTYKTLRQQYISIIDKAIMSVKTGTMDYNTSVRKSVEEMARSGIKVVPFQSGYARRLDSQIRMNILEGVSRLSQEMINITGKEFGADGYEITAHALCAPDHQHVQGNQYSKKEYDKLNNSLARPIGTLNCRHMAIPIVLGVSSPTYSKEELKGINDLSNKTVKYKDKSYTRYEASQEQRKLETKIRKEKEVLKAFESSGDKIGAKKSKDKIKELTALYKDFSKSVGLNIYSEKLRI